MEDQTTILIVDDEPAGREALEGVFYSQGYHLLFAENGQEAYDKALEFTPDLVLLDVMMPNMDGFEVCRKMRGHPLLEEIPILIVTALDDREARLKGIDSGADDFITKPFDRIELRARVRTITRLNRYRRFLLEKARFAWVVEQAGEGYLILNNADQIQYANQAARMLLGLPSDEDAPLPYTFQQIVAKSFRCEPEAAWRNWGQETEYESAPIYLIQPETEMSQPIWLEVKTLSLPGGSNRLLRINQVSEQISSLLGMWNFHSFLTHKLRTPISNLSFGVEILAYHASSLSAEEIAEIAGGMLASCKRMEGEVNDILKFIYTPSIMQGQQPIAISDVTASIQKVAGELGVEEVSVSLDPQLPIQKYLKLSRFAIDTIFTELLENSKKFHPQLSPRVEISIQPHGSDAIVITMKDDGTRLSLNQLVHAFTPYYQAEKYFTGEIDGMGLGLATVASLVWHSGGNCQLFNREDREGIILEISLPCSEEDISIMGKKSAITYAE